nr:exonuclease subunit SbcD [Portibacter lacus]
MKILHTADWHIGKNLHKVPLQSEFKMFLEWLLGIINDEAIDVLLISGDIFDYANPAAEDRKTYYEFLKSLVDTNTKIIITGGNHDSAGFLNAPREVLKALDIEVIGEATHPINQEIIPIVNDDGSVEVVIAAVPFLKDKDLRNRNEAEKFESRVDEIRYGIQNHYHQLAEIIKDQYPNVPSIAMGHLYTVGSDPSESERDIHMGNEAAVDAKIFSDAFDYVALGHIHRPQIIGKNEFIRYSGSPIALSFSEKKDIKSIIILTVDEGEIQKPKLIEVPKNRTLDRISGNLEEVRLALEDYENSFTLPAFLEIIVKEKEYSSVILSDFEELKTLHQDQPNYKVIKSKVDFEHGAKDIDALFLEGENIEDLKPTEVFAKKMESENIDDASKELMNEAFLELLSIVMNED